MANSNPHGDVSGYTISSLYNVANRDDINNGAVIVIISTIPIVMYRITFNTLSNERIKSLGII